MLIIIIAAAAPEDWDAPCVVARLLLFRARLAKGIMAVAPCALCGIGGGRPSRALCSDELSDAEDGRTDDDDD